jgi:hypothetical protein
MGGVTGPEWITKEFLRGQEDGLCRQQLVESDKKAQHEIFQPHIETGFLCDPIMDKDDDFIPNATAKMPLCSIFIRWYIHLVQPP